MKSRKLIFFILFSIMIIPNSHYRSVSANPMLNASDTVPLNFSENYQTDWDYNNSFQPTMPNVTQYLDNEFSDFDPAGSTVYTEDEQVPGYNGMWYFVTVTMTNLYITNDHDIGAGEIFIEGGINNADDRYPASTEYSMNDGENQVLSDMIFSGWAVTLGFNLEIRESDGALDDSLGFINGHYDNLVNESITLWTDINEASITFDIEVTQSDTVFLASELLEIYKPELWVDDETSSTEMPDFVFGRVIDGMDNGINALVLQYFFYWTAEYAPDLIGGFKTHDHDYEVFMIFLDKIDPIFPYRYVFNNWFYTDVTEAPSTTIAIFEDTTSTGEFVYDVEISPSLQGFLGTNVSLNAEVHDLSEITDWQYGLVSSENAFTYTPNGVVSVHMTVETSYHTFDLGPGGTEYGFAYAITPLTDDTIIELYSIIEDTFDAGVHIWTYFGIDIPKVAPFTFDVTQVFTAPYGITAYANVIDNAAAITRAQNARLDIDVSGYIGLNFEVPAEVEITHPTQLSYGTNSLSLALKPNIDQTEITLFYGLSVNISYVFWFMSGEILYDQQGEITINPFTDEVTSLAGLLGLGDFERSDIEINDYLSAGFVLHPTLLGPIIEGELSLNLLEVIKNIFKANPYVRIIIFLLEFIVDDFSLTLSATLEAVIRHDIQTTSMGVSLSQSTLTYSDETPQTIDVIIEEGVDLSQGVVLTIPEADYDLDFYVDWSLELGFKSPIDSVIPDISIPIGTLPSWTANLLTSTGGSVTIPGPSPQSSSSTEISDTGSESSDDAGVNGPVVFVIFSYIVVTTIIVRKKK
ncbi:MAG: hypothetical protein HeimC2_17860 [Candidatus Heimdallarchaeota archaeon LC_2]|nr:MAG: hypothetical protein HeimC2_28410 [Candidatus Heimdallarchaeota archaeon LC_2]OLS25530.1 MAG: hypothetical protein HeimC2_17860 [Candidatus Heimdallarchaeota archaeon LC_2]